MSIQKRSSRHREQIARGETPGRNVTPSNDLQRLDCPAQGGWKIKPISLCLNRCSQAEDSGTPRQAEIWTGLKLQVFWCVEVNTHSVSMYWAPTFCQALFTALQTRHWAKLTCLAGACRPGEEAGRPAAERTKVQSAVGWESRRAQGGEGKEPLKYFRGVAEEAMLELNGKPELCTEACLQRQGKKCLEES